MPKQPFNIWWKLTPLAALSTILIWVALILLRTHEELFIQLRFPLLAGYFIVNGYLSSCVFWHWKTRYQGRYSLGWAVAFTVWWMALPTVLYFLAILLPELLGKNSHSKPPKATTPTTSLSAQANGYRSVLFVIGTFLVIWGLLASAASGTALYLFTQQFSIAIPGAIPEKMTAETGKTLLTLFLTTKVLTIILTTAAFGAALGAIALFTSQRIKWRIEASTQPDPAADS